MSAIKSIIQKHKQNKKWRSLNKHNSTFLTRTCDISLINVGKHTYGPLYVINSSDNYMLKIGNFCSIADNVTFCVCGDHSTNKLSTFPFKVLISQSEKFEAISKGDIVIDDDVWIGCNSTILSGVNIGQGAVIAACSLVNKDVPPYAIVAGVPARVIKKRFPDEIVEKLLKVDFSKFSDKFIIENIDMLYDQIDENKIDEIIKKLETNNEH